MTPAPQNLEFRRVLVVGFGSIARRHLHNLKLIDPEIEVAVWRQYSHDKNLGEFSSAVKDVFLNQKDALAWVPHAAIIANPARFHLETAFLLAQKGVHLFIEKPLSSNLEGIDELSRLCKQQGVTAAVGYNFRCYRPFQVIKKLLEEGLVGKILSARASAGYYLPAWRPQADYRKSVSAKKELGGGVLLELSHEVDYLRWLIGEIGAVRAQAGRLSRLEIDVEDTADLLFLFKSGIFGNLHLDMVDHARSRNCRIVGSLGTLLWDGIDHSVKIFKSQKNEWENLLVPGEVDLNDMYVEELRVFFKAAKNNVEPIVSLHEATQTLKVVLAAQEAAKEKRAILL